MARPARKVRVHRVLSSAGGWATAGQIADRIGLPISEVRADLVKLRAGGAATFRRQEYQAGRSHEAGEWLANQ